MAREGGAKRRRVRGEGLDPSVVPPRRGRRRRRWAPIGVFSLPHAERGGPDDFHEVKTAVEGEFTATLDEDHPEKQSKGVLFNILQIGREFWIQYRAEVAQSLHFLQCPFAPRPEIFGDALHHCGEDDVRIVLSLHHVEDWTQEIRHALSIGDLLVFYGVNCRDIHQLLDVFPTQVRGLDRRRRTHGAVSGRGAPVVTTTVIVKGFGWVCSHGVATNAVVEMLPVLMSGAVSLGLDPSLESVVYQPQLAQVRFTFLPSHHSGMEHADQVRPHPFS